LVIIMVEISMGLFLMESLRITRLFPVISALSDKMRRRMMFVTFVILLLMASIEAGLAYARSVVAGRVGHQRSVARRWSRRDGE
jgi:hypothetical protein